MKGKYSVPYRQENKDNILSAVRHFAQSVNSDSKLNPDISTLVDETSKLSLKNIDFWERLIRWEFSKELENSIPSKWQFWIETSSYLTWINLCSENGFKREKVLHTLSEGAPNGFFFAIALRRLNDWVPQVRKAARERLPIIAKYTDPEFIVDALCATLPHWNSWARMEDKDKQVLMEIASIEKVGQSLKSRILSATTGPMTSVLSQMGRTETLDSYLEEIAKKAKQPSVRAKSYRYLFEGKMVWFTGRAWEWTDKRYCLGHFKPILCERNLPVTSPLLETLQSAAIDRSPIVRRIAGEILIRDLDKISTTESLKLAQLLASDPWPSIAERGTFALKKLAQ